MVQNIEKKIKQKLSEKGWTVKKLVADLEMSEIGFSKMLANNSIKLVTLEKIAAIFGCNIDFFLKDNDEILENNLFKPELEQKLKTETKVSKDFCDENGNKQKFSEMEIEYLQKLLEEKEKVIKSKDELIELLRKK